MPVSNGAFDRVWSYRETTPRSLFQLPISSIVWLGWVLLLWLVATASIRADPIAVAENQVAVNDPQGQIATETRLTTRELSDHPVYLTTFTTQLPADPARYDAPIQTSGFSGCTADLNPRPIQYLLPDDGVTSSTGLLVILPGMNASQDCSPYFQIDPEIDGWVEQKDLVVAQVYYRNLGFYPRYDYGKYQIVDTLRGLGHLLSLFPQIDRRRLYLLGGSGGGLVALQVALASRGLWAEVYAESSITRITLPSDVTTDYPEDPSSGWNVNLGFPTVQGSLTDAQWERYEAERDLRGPQNSLRVDPITGPEAPPIAALHGTADTTVDVQHFYALKEAVEAGVGQSATQIADNVWQLANWRFVAILNGNHGFSGAAADQNTRAKAINCHFPDVFTARKATAPDLGIQYSLPLREGYTFQVQGATLQMVELNVMEAPACVPDWILFRADDSLSSQ